MSSVEIIGRRGDGKRPIVVLSGGQAFVQRRDPSRVERDLGRIATILPPGRSFVLLGYRVGDTLTLATLVADVAAVLQELETPSTLVGISYGGIIAVRVAAEHPALVQELVLLASAHDFSAEGRARVNVQLECAARGDLAELVRGMTAVFRRPWFNWLLALRMRMMRGELVAKLNDPANIVKGLAAVLGADLADTRALANITARCLIVGGSRDQFFGDGTMQATAAAIPGARLALIPGETHMVPVERARDVRAEITAFLER